MTVPRKPGWALPDSAATPEAAFNDRRRLLKAMGVGAIILAAPAAARLGEPDVAPPPPMANVPLPVILPVTTTLPVKLMVGAVIVTDGASIVTSPAALIVILFLLSISIDPSALNFTILFVTKLLTYTSPGNKSLGLNCGALTIVA